MIEKTEIINILKANNFEYYGVRGINHEYAIGEWIDEQSVSWGTEEEIELGGICVTLANHLVPQGDYVSFRSKYDEEIEEAAEAILKAIEYNTGAYEHKNYYLVGSDDLDVGNANDDYEGVLETAITLAKI